MKLNDFSKLFQWCQNLRHMYVNKMWTQVCILHVYICLKHTTGEWETHRKSMINWPIWKLKNPQGFSHVNSYHVTPGMDSLYEWEFWTISMDFYEFIIIIVIPSWIFPKNLMKLVCSKLTIGMYTDWMFYYIFFLFSFIELRMHSAAEQSICGT